MFLAAEMAQAAAGLYKTAGDWVCNIGLPGKSGIGGGIVTVTSGKGGPRDVLAAPNAAGNSV
jgi:glutaminase